MSFAVTVKDAQDLRRLIPLNILSASRFEELCAKTGIEEVGRGSVLFQQGDAKNEFVYVLSGTVSLQAGGMEMETITGGTESARFALAHQIPRKVSAIAKDRVRYIRVDAVYVNQPNEKATGSVATYEVSDIPSDAGDDWITTLLKSPIFQRLPPANLQNILSLMEEVGVRAGQEIIHQDEPGDYYYVIKRGRCALTRKPSRLAREIKLAELKTTDTFGEDALISDQPRNVTVTMMTDGVLLRLNKANFLKLVKEPVISFVNMDTARRMLQQGARWLDVRAPDSFDEAHLPGSVNIPFFRLRMELPSLSHQYKYIIVCETGKVSEAAAFLLIRYEFDAFVLKGGVSGVFKDQLVAGGEKIAPVPQPAMVPAPPPAALSTGLGLVELEAPAVPHEIEFVSPKIPAVVGAELADLNRLMGRLLEESESLRSNEELLLEQVQVAESRTDEAAKRVADLHADLSRALETQDDSEAGASLPTGELAERLTQALTQRDELQRLLQEAHEQQNAAEANWSKTLSELQADRAAAERSLSDARATNERMSLQLQQLQMGSAQEEGATESRLVRLREELAAAMERNRELEQQVAELSSLVQEFVEQHGHDEEDGGDGLEALRTELEMVRSQAERDVVSMQRKLRDTEQESARLRSELDTAQQRLLLSEVGISDGSGKGRAGGRLPWIVALFGMLLLGAAAVFLFAVGTEGGRELTRGMIGPPPQIEQPTSGLPAPG